MFIISFVKQGVIKKKVTGGWGRMEGGSPKIVTTGEIITFFYFVVISVLNGAFGVLHLFPLV